MTMESRESLIPKGHWRQLAIVVLALTLEGVDGARRMWRRIRTEGVAWLQGR